MREVKIQLARRSQKVAKLSRRFPTLKTLRDLETYCFESVPLECSFSAAGGILRLRLGIELERLLGISREVSLAEQTTYPAR